MESSEKIITNCDVLEAIFHYLDFKEHLKLLEICTQFEYAILHGVWRSKCKNLHMLQTFPDTFLLQYNAVNNVMRERSLAPEAIHIILKHSSMYIQKLDLTYIVCLENLISYNYQHLTELKLCGIVVEDIHLQQLAKNCLNLQSLTLICFRSSKKESNIRVNVFGGMKALNKLEINDMNFTAWNYFDVQQLFCLAHLETLIIDIKIGCSNDNSESNNNSTERVYNIENLTIGTLTYLQFGNVNFIKDLILFENLTKLSIKLNRVSILSLDHNVLTQINNACPKLCELSFIDCYLTFKEFPRMNNLKHLTLERCSNIKFEDFNEIFQKLKLKSLSLVTVLMRVKAEDICDYNYISNTLETLNIDAIADRNIATTFCNPEHKFQNVSTVRLVTNLFLRPQSTGLCFSHNFPNLQQLIMKSYYISIKDILYLKHLKVLQFDLFDNMSWSYLEILFQHPTLTHITITLFNCRHFEKHYERLPKCCEGLTTTLEYLSLPSVVYERALNFWPSFRQRNKLLKLEIVDGDTLKNSMS